MIHMEIPEFYKNYNPGDFMMHKTSYIVEWQDWKGNIRKYQAYAGNSHTAAFICGQMHHTDVAKVISVRKADNTDYMREMKTKIAEWNIEAFLEKCERQFKKCTGSVSSYSVSITVPGDTSQRLVMEPVGEEVFVCLYDGLKCRFDEPIKKSLSEQVYKLAMKIEKENEC